MNWPINIWNNIWNVKLLSYYRPPMESEGVYCFGVVRPSVLPSFLLPSVRPSFRLTLHLSVRISFPRYFSATTGWNSTKLCGYHQYQRERGIYVPCLGQTLQHRVIVLDELWSIHLVQISFPRYFSATAGWNSTTLYGNHQYQEEMRISLPCLGQIIRYRVMALG
jgi:hypothetical protein